MRQMRPRCGSPARVANHSSKISDDQNGLMSEVLKLPQLPQHNRVAEMNVGGGRVDPELDTQRTTERQLLAQLIFANDLCCAFS